MPILAARQAHTEAQSALMTKIVTAIVILCAALAAFVILITLLRPGDNLPIITVVSVPVVSVIMGLLALLAQNIHLSLNSRYTAALETQGRASFAEGRQAERDQQEKVS